MHLLRACRDEGNHVRLVVRRLLLSSCCSAVMCRWMGMYMIMMLLGGVSVVLVVLVRFVFSGGGAKCIAMHGI